jgi:hypothetical protein
MKAPKVIVVLLRQPSTAVTERRDDPFWEFGSFGCTGCHSRNLMNPKRAHELNGARLAFVQGGLLGFRLVHVTSEIWMEPVGSGFEARWPPGQMPLKYASAPLVIDNDYNSDIPLLAMESRGVLRSTPVARFASAFRSRRSPVAGDVGAAIIACYRRRRTPARVAKTYEDAMPHPPPIIERSREQRYRAIRKMRGPSAPVRSPCKKSETRKAPVSNLKSTRCSA